MKKRNTMKASIKLLLIGCILTVTGCQTRIEYTSPLGDKFVYVRPWLDRKEIQSLRVGGDQNSRVLEVEGYSSNPEWQAIPAIVGAAVEAGIGGAGKAVAP